MTIWIGDKRGRLAKSLVKLYEQINEAYPGRKTSDDGSVGDSAHASRKSDHNPDPRDKVVRALDITHDPLHGVDTYAMAEYLRTHPDKRIRYIISDSRISGSPSFAHDNGGKAWQWARYTGANAHDRHIHISVERANQDDQSAWDWGQAGMVPPLPVTASPLRLAMAKWIINFEARRDSKGHLMIYTLPSNDGGGRYEVAGINDRYDGPAVRELVGMLNAQKYDAAEKFAEEYIAANTDTAAAWTTDPGVEFYLRDSVFNRGARGAARILQRAVGVKDDGIVGPLTCAAIAKINTADLLLKLRIAREDYERNVVGYRENFWRGLVSRWDKALVTAQEFRQKENS